MRNKILYVYTENLNFFYRLNKELIHLNVKFKILNVRTKLPIHNSIVLTTSEEVHKFKKIFENVYFLPYSDGENFNHYILKMLAAYRIDYKDYYSELTFSIDPGTKHIGLVVFLDDYFLASHTIYDKNDFIKVIKEFITCFQKNNPNLINLQFKFGRGFARITIDLVKETYNSFKNRNRMKVFLIDESKSSKIKIQDKSKKIRTKHEISALILALRKGLEINQTNYYKTIKQIKLENSNDIKGKEIINEEINDSSSKLKEVIESILNNEVSLSESSELIKKSRMVVSF